MDGWLSESDHEITRAVLKEKIRLASLGLISITFQDFLKYTTVDNNYETRLLAFEGLLCLGGLKNAAILNLFFTVIKIEPSTFFKYSLLRVFSKCIGIAAMEGTPSVLDDDEFIRQYAVTLDLLLLLKDLHLKVLWSQEEIVLPEALLKVLLLY
ncbi:unnamed protein product [[Candida] boidinii]|nr:unnamed protein product [[Candida] boidinii]